MRMIINIIMSQPVQLKSVYELELSMYMLGCKKNYMTENKTSILLSDISVDGDVVEKDKVIVDAKVSGDIKAEEVITHSKSNIIGNIKSKIASLGGKLKGNVSSDKITVKKTANIEGVLNQKTLTVQEGAQLKIKTETYK